MILEGLLASQLSSFKPIQAPLRACVCVIFRLAPGSTPALGPNDMFKDAAEMRSWIGRSSTRPLPVEVLFIRRAHNPRDRWSGHIGFPGGRSNPGEAEIDTAHRECKEELGLDLTAPRFALLGRLDDRLVRGKRRPMVVTTFVFTQLDTAELPFKLQATEIAEAFWADARLLHGASSRLQELLLPVESLKLPRPLRAAASLLLVSGMSFPCVFLKGPDPAYALWGLSFSIVSDALAAAGLPSLRQRVPAELPRMGPLPFRTASALVNAIIGLFYNGAPPGSAALLGAVLALLAAAAVGGTISSRL